MIQRIQSLYLLIVAVLMAAMLFCNFATASVNGGEFTLDAWGVVVPADAKVAADGTIVLADAMVDSDGIRVANPFLGILIAVALLGAVVVIFLYRRRLAQLRFCLPLAIVLIGLQVMQIIYLLWFSDQVPGVVYSIADVFPIVSVILVYLAFRGISRDLLLLRSADRIR